MKKSVFIFPFIFLLLISCKENSPEETQADVSQPASSRGVVILKTTSLETDTVKKSLRAFVTKKIGEANFTITYHSPAVRNRIIWGGLVPYGQVWVTGAHSATALECDTDFYMGSKKIKAGKYALFTIPGEDVWVFILNKNWNQHLADEYDEKEDACRLTVKPEPVEDVQERLMYQIKVKSETEGMISLAWEKLAINIPIRVSN